MTVHQGRRWVQRVAGRALGVVALMASTCGQAQMTMPGQFAVSPSGAATYSIPIQVPPGVAGMEPKLALVYNSQAGNGLLGVGWALSGLSSITRCPKTVSQDNASFPSTVAYNTADKFCMDGQRLFALNGAADGGDGTAYRLEQESYSSVVSSRVTDVSINSGPGKFVAKTKSGLIMEFGGTIDSRVFATTPNASIINSWLLNKVTDAKGNTMSFVYSAGDTTTGQSYLLRIEYGGNISGTPSKNVVFFDYEFNRPDTLLSYHAGSLNQLTARITKISTAANVAIPANPTSVLTNQLQYKLTYDTTSKPSVWSLLKTVQVCTASGSSCLPAFQTSGATEVASLNVNGQDTWPSWGERLYVGDFDGDGKTDLLITADNSKGVSWGGWKLRLSTGTNYSEVNSGTWPSWGERIFVGDFNGDGKSDLLVTADPSCACWSGWKLLISTGSGFQQVAADTWPAYGEEFTLGDFNGDGKTDFIVQGTPSYKWEGWKLYTSTGTGFTVSATGAWPSWGERLQVGDFNGDGMQDLFVTSNGSCHCWEGWKIYQSNGAGFAEAANGTWPSWSEVYTFGDFNGDGKTDMVVQGTANGWGGWKLFVSTGIGLSQVGAGNWPSWGEQLYVGDFNGDGKTDVLVTATPYCACWSGWNVFLSTGTNLVSAVSGSWPAWGERFITSDFNGDGKTDFFVTALSSSTSSLAGWRLYLNDSTPFGVSTVFTNGVSQRQVTYRTLPNLGAGYVKDSNINTATQRTLTPTLSVVSSIDAQNGVSGVTTANYAYGNFSVDATPSKRGSLGFQWTQSKDVATGLVSRTCYRQDWPYVGLVDKVMTATSDAGLPACNSIVDLSPLTTPTSNLLSLTVNSYKFQSYAPSDTNYASPTVCQDDPLTGKTATSCPAAATQALKRYQAYGFQSLTQSRDWDGTTFIALPASKTTVSQDNWGNVTQVKAETLNTDGKTASGYSKTTTNTYMPVDSANWLLGRLQKSQVQAVSP